MVFKALKGQLELRETVLLFTITLLAFPARLLIPYALVFDTVITILIIMLFKNIRLYPSVAKFMEICGKHSFNIFLFHTFLFYLYIPQIIYWHRNPIIILITLLFFCLIISYTIEYGKEKMGYNRFLKRINAKVIS